MVKQGIIRRFFTGLQHDRRSLHKASIEPEQRLNDTQRRTIEWLRKRAIRVRAKRMEMLKAYVARQKKHLEELPAAKPALPESLSKYPKYPMIRASMPVTADNGNAVIEILKTVSEGDKATYLEFSGGLKQGAKILASDSKKKKTGKTVGRVIVDTSSQSRKDGPPSFGLELSADENGRLRVSFRYRPVSGPLRLADDQRAQGDSGLRLATAHANEVGSKALRARSTGKSNRSSQTDMEKVINGGVEDLLSGGETVNLFGYETIPIDDVAWQDFSEYLCAIPLSVMQIDASPNLNLEVIETLIEAEEDDVDSSELGQFVDALNSALGRRIATDVSGYVVVEFPFTWSEPALPGQVNEFIESFVTNAAQRALQIVMSTLDLDPDTIATLAELLWATPIEHRQSYLNWVAANFRPADQQPGNFYFYLGTVPSPDAIASLPGRWGEVKSLAQAVWSWVLEAEVPPAEPPEVVPPYNFVYFVPYTYNLGLRLIRRQEWRALGNQRGEIVKTIPLGPKQSEKVSTRITRRTKVVRTSENLKSLETTSEVATSTKDASETIEEASNTFNWYTEAEASANFMFGSASVSGGEESSEEERSRQTDAHLTETSQKMASKLRQETKVTVSTESESTFETTTASEITNPNEEVALTYVYSKLQRQYRLFTRLAEVHNVVMFAEPLPAPEEIDDAWVRRHDAILAKALLDDSYRDVLGSFRHDRPPEPLASDVLTEIKDTLDNIAGQSGYLQKIGDTVSSISLDRIDPSQEAQRGYRDTQQAELERKRAHDLLLQKRRRFTQHIRDNLLHYYRAIWASEDPQQRALRYRKINVHIPLQWEFVPGPPEATGTLSLNDLLDMLVQMESSTIPYADIPGYFRPIASSETVALADLINNSGPIGYEGNYSIYYLNPRYENTDLFLMLQILKAPYLHEDDAGQQTVVDPALKALRRKHAGEGPASYSVQLDMARIVPDVRLQYAMAKRKGDEDEKAFFEVFKLTKDSIDTMDAKTNVPAPVIAELRDLEVSTDAKKRRNEDTHIDFLSEGLNSAVVDEYRETLLRYSDQGIFTAFYPEFLLRKRQGSPFLLDTGNLVIDIEPGTGSALESFKLMHRGIDVLKALEEKKQLEQESMRRKKLIESDKLGDPDIEKVTIVAGEGSPASDIVAGIAAGESSGDDDNGG